jgi:hypothetical protein
LRHPLVSGYPEAARWSYLFFIHAGGESVVREQRGLSVDEHTRRELESLLAVGSAIAWGALAISVWGYVERSRARRVRHVGSNKSLTQVFPSGRVD